MSELFIATRTIGENASKSYSIIFDNITTVTLESQSNVKVYRNGSDVTSTVMPSGTHTTSNNVLTLKAIEPHGFGGDTLIINIKVDADGQDEVRFIKLLVASEETGKVRVK